MSRINDITQYVYYKSKNTINKNSYFNTENYLKKYPDLKNYNKDPLLHYVLHGKKEGRTDTYDINVQNYDLVKKSGLFDYNYYTEEYNLNDYNYNLALLHYLETGYKKGYNPSKQFNGNNYLKKYPEVKETNLNPLVHYLKYGKKEEKTDKCDKNTKEYNLAKESGLYDHEYYMKECRKGFYSSRNGLLHYLEIGFKKGFNPGPHFDGVKYLKKYKDVEKSGLNPLVHYIKYGLEEKRFGMRELTFKNFNSRYNVTNILNKIDEKITIIILVNDFDNVKNSIDNIMKKTYNYEIYLIRNDNIDLNDFQSNPNITIIENSGNIPDEINKIFEKCKTDVIIMKDNIIVFDKWAMKLVMAAHSNDNIGFVSPISNYTTINLYEPNEKNSIKYTQDIINRTSKRNYDETPLPSDSVIYIKNDVFKGLKIDEKENNWLKAYYKKGLEKGWAGILDDSTFVYYKKTDKINNINHYENQPYPDFVNSKAFENCFNNLEDSIKYFKNEEKIKKNVLITLHYGGGVEHSVKDIAKSISEDYNSYILQSYKTKLILYKLVKNNITPIKEFVLSDPWNSKMIHSDEYVQIYFYILVNYNIDLIEMDHMMFHTFDLPKLAKTLRIPIIIALHDFYLVCPTYFFLDENNEYCGGYCGNKPRNCSKRVKWFDLPVNIVEWKEEWKEYVYELLFKRCDAIITATPFTKNMFLEHYPQLKNEDIKIIEHGRDLIKYDNFNTPPNPYQKIKILIPGTISIHKGSEFIKKLIKVDTKNKLEFHFIGYVDEELQQLGVYHGKYTREDFAKFVSKIKPSFIGIFSIWAETYSYTLTESLSTGVPVFASDIGALKYRIEKYGGGWLIDYTNPESTYHKILEIVNDKNEYKKVKKEVDLIKTTTMKEMGNNYKKLYKNLEYKK